MKKITRYIILILIALVLVSCDYTVDEHLFHEYTVTYNAGSGSGTNKSFKTTNGYHNILANSLLEVTTLATTGIEDSKEYTGFTKRDFSFYGWMDQDGNYYHHSQDATKNNIKIENDTTFEALWRNDITGSVITGSQYAEITNYTGNAKTLIIPQVITIWNADGSHEDHLVTQIASSAIQSTALKNVVLPESIETIEENAFTGCTNLTNVQIESTKLTTVDNNAFPQNENLKVQVPETVVETYKTNFTAISNKIEKETESQVTVNPNQTTMSIIYLDKDGSAFTGTHGTNYPQNHTYGTSTTLVAPTKDKYTFDGWFTSSDCSGTAVTMLAAKDYTTDITLYAKWIIDNYTVTFDVQGHGIAPTSASTDYNTTITAPTAPTETGYTFGGWYKESGCSNAWNFNTDKVTAATTLYAKWTPNKYTVTFDKNDNNAVVPSPATLEVTFDSTYGTLATTTKSNWTFAGWYDSATGGNKIESTTKVEKAQDHTLYAHWAAIPVTGVSLNKTTTTLIIEGTETLTATVTPTDAANKNVTWSSSAETVASVDPTGKITAKAKGSTTITVTTEDGSKTATCTVTVNKKTPTVTAPTAKTGLTYSESALELIDTGSTTGGTLKYSVGDSEPSDNNYSTNIPSGTNADTYKVWYKSFGNDNFNDSTAESVDVTIAKADQTLPDAPTASSVGVKQVILTAITTGQGDTIYGCSKTNNAADVTNWKKETTFTSLDSNTTYYFFAKYEGNDNYKEAISTGTEIKTNAAEFSIENSLTNAVSVSGNATKIKSDEEITLTYEPEGEYSLPTSATNITVEGATIVSWTPTNEDGKNTSAVLKIKNPTKNVTITIVAGSVPEIKDPPTSSFDLGTRLFKGTIEVENGDDKDLTYQWYYAENMEITKNLKKMDCYKHSIETFLSDTPMEQYFWCKVTNQYGNNPKDKGFFHVTID